MAREWLHHPCGAHRRGDHRHRHSGRPRACRGLPSPSSPTVGVPLFNVVRYFLTFCLAQIRAECDMSLRDVLRRPMRHAAPDEATRCSGRFLLRESRKTERSTSRLKISQFWRCCVSDCYVSRPSPVPQILLKNGLNSLFFVVPRYRVARCALSEIQTL